MHFNLKQFGKANSQKHLTVRSASNTVNDPSKHYEERKDTLIIEEQALEELEVSTKAWEVKFSKWSAEWRKGIESISFDNVKAQMMKVLEAHAHTAGDDSYLSEKQLSNGLKDRILFGGLKSPRPKVNRQSIDSKHADYADAYQHYGGSSVSSIDLNVPVASTPPAESGDPDSYEISIVEDDDNYAKLAREVPGSHHSKSSQLHIYHNFLV